MPQDEFNPLFPAAAGSYPKAPVALGLPEPAPLGPAVTPLPRASSCWYTNLVCAGTDVAFAVVAHAPAGSTIVLLILAPPTTPLAGTLVWALRGHNSLPATRAQFESGPLILPTHINRPGNDDYANAPYYGNHLTLSLSVRLPQGSPLIVLGLVNAGIAADHLNLYLIIDPPPGHQP